MAPKIIYACAPDAQEDVPEEPSHDDGDSNKAYA